MTAVVNRSIGNIIFVAGNLAFVQVLRLLEVPGEKVTASSAAFALQRLSQLCSATGSDEMDSFIRKAVLHELCETVIQGLSELPNSTVVTLAGHAALASSGYDAHFVCDVNNEVSRTSQWLKNSLLL